MTSDNGMTKVSIRELLRNLGLRPTRQRIAIAKLLLTGGHRHVSADELFLEAQQAGVRLACTTVYNILHQFTQAGLIREVVVEAGRTWFDTNTSPHVHLLHEDSGEIEDVAIDPLNLDLARQLGVPLHLEVCDIDIVVRVKGKSL